MDDIISARLCFQCLVKCSIRVLKVFEFEEQTLGSAWILLSRLASKLIEGDQGNNEVLKPAGSLAHWCLSFMCGWVRGGCSAVFRRKKKRLGKGTAQQEPSLPPVPLMNQVSKTNAASVFLICWMCGVYVRPRLAMTPKMRCLFTCEISSLQIFIG